MKVLFVSSGNAEHGISSITKNQAESLRNYGIDIDHFLIIGKGFKGYISNIFKLRKYLINNDYDLIHAHYSLTAFIVSLATNIPTVVSLMGSPIQKHFLGKKVIQLFHLLRWKATIVKSERMKRELSLNNSIVIPNGVDFGKFMPMNKEMAKQKLLFNARKHIIFVAYNHNRKAKNFELAQQAIKLLNDDNIELNVLSKIDHTQIPLYMNAADALLLTSNREGSPNVIKEAMACNLPIVSTNVGDVTEVIGNIKGCYLTTNDPKDIADKIKLALEFSGRTNGRDQIQHLDVNTIAKQVIKVYEGVIKKKKRYK